MELVVYDAVRVHNKSVWYKVCCRDDRNYTLFYPTSRVMYELVRGDLKALGQFRARVELENKRESGSQFFRSYDVITRDELPKTASYEYETYKKPSGSLY